MKVLMNLMLLFSITSLATADEVSQKSKLEEDAAVKSLKKWGADVDRNYEGTGYDVSYSSTLDPTVTDFMNLRKLKNLTALDISGTEISEQTVSHLSELTNLEYLNISYTKLTDAELIHLKGLKNLEELDLSDTAVTNSGLAYLKDLKRLKWLDLSNTRVTPAAVHALRKQSPDLEVVHRWTAMIFSVGGKATIDTTGVTFVFEGISMWPGGGGGGGLQVTGPGSGETAGGGFGAGFGASYSQGIATIKIRDYTLKLSNNGAKLTFGEQTFDLSKEKQIIAINPKGVARIVKRTGEQNEK